MPGTRVAAVATPIIAIITWVGSYAIAIAQFPNRPAPGTDLSVSPIATLSLALPALLAAAAIGGLAPDTVRRDAHRLAALVPATMITWATAGWMFLATPRSLAQTPGASEAWPLTMATITPLTVGMLMTVLPWSTLTAWRAVHLARKSWPATAAYPLAADHDCTKSPAKAATASRWALDRLAAPETVASETRIVSPTRVSTLNEEPSCCCVALLPFAGFSRWYTKSEPVPSPATVATLPTVVVTTHFIPEPGSDSSTPEPAHRPRRDVIAVNAAFAAPGEA